MRRILLMSIVAMCLLLLPAQAALAAPCAGACGDEATCSGAACGNNHCPCDTGDVCVCIANDCECPAPCNDEKGCSGACPTKASCRPAISQAGTSDEVHEHDHDEAADTADEATGTDEADARDDDAADGTDDHDEMTGTEDSDKGSAKKAAATEDEDAEEDEGSTSILPFVIVGGIIIFGGGAGAFALMGRKKEGEDQGLS